MPGVTIEPKGIVIDPELALTSMRERAFRRELELIAHAEQLKARRIRGRAARLPVRSNGREKLLAKAAGLEEHAAVLLATATNEGAA